MQEHLLPSQQPEQNKIPVEVLKPQVDSLITIFTGKLEKSPEFKDALIANYLKSKGNLEEVAFVKEDYQYFVYLMAMPEEEPSAEWRTLRIQRTPLAEYSPGKVPNEYLSFDITKHTPTEYEVQAMYRNYETGLRALNTSLALQKAEEIIEAF